jgi:uncharacterized protein (DUF433 family)
MEKQFNFITYDPAIFNGKPIIVGTRISVEFIMELIASGSTVDEISKVYPHIPIEGIREAILYAAASQKNEILISAKITA